MVSLASGSESLNVWKFDNDNLNLLSNFRTDSGRCSCLAWNHTNQVVASGGADNRVYLIQANNGQILSSLQVAEENAGKRNANAVAFSNNSRFLAATLENHLQLWDLKRRQMKSVMTDHRGQITACCFLPTGDIISGDQCGAVRIWDAKAFLSSPELILPNTAPAAVTSLSISPASAAHLATGYNDGFLGVWDTATFKLVRRQQCHRGSLNAVAYSPRNPRLVATGGNDYRVTLLDTASRNTADPSAAIEIADRTNITCISFHEDAIHTAIGLGNGNIVIYDWRKIKQPVVSITAHEYNPVLALAFQVPKASKSSDASATSGASMSTTATAPVAPPSATKKVSDTPTRMAATTSAHPAAVASSIPPTTSVVPPAVPYSRMSIDSTASQRSNTNPEKGAISPDTSSLKRLHNVTSPARVDLPPPPAAAPPQVQERSQDHKPQVPTTVVSADKLPRSAVKPQPQQERFNQTHSHASSLPVPQQLEVSFDRSVGTARSVVPLVSSSNDRAQNTTSSDHTLPGAPSSAGAENTNDDGRSHNQRGHAEESNSYAGLRQVLKPVTAKDLEESLQLLRYDIHREVQDVIREQIRQFSIAKDDTAELLKELNIQVADLLKANRDLRAENEYLRRIY